MGVDPFEPNRNCYSCKPCKDLGYIFCDRCERSCCINCIKEHDKLFNLALDFKEKVNSALEYAKDKINSLDNDLRDKDIFVSWTNDINQYLQNMKEKKSEIQDECSNWNTNEIRNEYEKKFIEVGNRHKLEEHIIDNNFYLDQKRLENEMNNKKYYHNINMDSKRIEKNNLQNELNQTKRDNPIRKEQALNTYKAQLRINAENNFIQQKENIDKNPNYQKIEKKLEYSEEEKTKINQYISEVNKIYEYSKVIPEDLINNLLN